jgi:hypothetical protein
MTLKASTTAGILGLLFLSGCVHPIALTRQMSDVASTGVTVSNNTKTLSFSSSIDDNYEYKSNNHTFQFRLNESFESQLKDLFEAKYPNHSVSSETVEIHLVSASISGDVEQTTAQRWLLTGRGTYKASAKMTFSVSVGKQTKTFSVSKEAENPVSPYSDTNSIAERTQKAAMEGLLTMAIIKINKHLD